MNEPAPLRSAMPDYIERILKAVPVKECLSGYIPFELGVSYQQFARVASGRKRAGVKFLNALNNFHIRHFPGERIELLLPNQPPVILGSLTLPN